MSFNFLQLARTTFFDFEATSKDIRYTCSIMQIPIISVKVLLRIQQDQSLTGKQSIMSYYLILIFQLIY